MAETVIETIYGLTTAFLVGVAGCICYLYRKGKL